MRFKYWTIRVGFGGLRVGSVGAGIIVTAPDQGISKMRMISSLDSLPRSLEARKPVIEWLRALEKEVNGFEGAPQLELDHRASVETMIDRLARQMHNVIRIDKPRTASGESLAAITDLLFTQMIGGDSRPAVRRERNQILSEIRAAYSARPLVSERLVERPDLIVGHRDNLVDFAVLEDDSSDVYEISHAFSFVSTSNPRSLIANVDSWTWGVDTLRSSGAQLRLAEGKTINIAETTPVVAVVSPPETDEQREIYARATAEWPQLKVQAITPAELEAHALSLSITIQSA